MAWLARLRNTLHFEAVARAHREFGGIGLQRDRATWT